MELEKAFRLAARETNAAIKRARENLQMKSTEQKTIACSNCGSKNQADAVFCTSCGTKVAPNKGSHDCGTQ